MSSLCYDIRNYFEGCSGWVANNFYGPSTTASYVYQCSDAIRGSSSYDYLATFHAGHMFPDFVEYGHWEIVGYDEYGFPIWEWIKDGEVRHYAYYGSQGTYDGIEDFALHPHTGAKHYFTMIWTCTNGDLFITPSSQLNYSYEDTQHGTGIVGMPRAWTQLANLSFYGYDDPWASNFCYIGFENMSKPLTEPFEGSEIYNYADFIRRFYYHALYDIGCTIHLALDRATRDMGVNMYYFNSTGNDLYHGWEQYEPGKGTFKCRMRVIGDGDNRLGVAG